MSHSLERRIYISGHLWLVSGEADAIRGKENGTLPELPESALNGVLFLASWTSKSLESIEHSMMQRPCCMPPSRLWKNMCLVRSGVSTLAIEVSFIRLGITLATLNGVIGSCLGCVVFEGELLLSTEEVELLVAP